MRGSAAASRYTGPRVESDSQTRLVTLAAMLGASALAHLLLWPVGNLFIGERDSTPIPRAGGIMEVQLLPTTPAEEAREAEERALLEDEDKKLVALDRVPDERMPDEDTKYLSEFTSRTDHETRAPKQRPLPGSSPSVTGDRPEGRNGRSQDAASQDRPQATPLPLVPGAASSQGEGRSSADSSVPDGSTSDAPAKSGALGSLSPAGSPGTRKALMNSLGQHGTFDDLDQIDEGDETILNSKRWKFASFFNRIRSGVSQHWHPEVVHAARDPDGKIFGTKTRRTKLVISLNADGSLHGIELEGASGADYLDEEAIRAVRAAAPFANPPPGLVDRKTNKIVFGFAFIFEIDGRTRIFRYQR